ncbi:MAG: esterase-like activity of phytase family protein [Holophaga sp.]|nr:esterase-like activity of phytase family protein [Holophaga sp.]
MNIRQTLWALCASTLLLLPVGCSNSHSSPGSTSSGGGAATGLQFIAQGSLDGATDLSGLTGTLENGNPAAILGGLGSGLAWAGGTTFIAIPDRGPNALAYDSTVDNTTSYIERFHTIQMSLTANTSGSGLPYLLTPTLTNTTLMASSTALNYGTASSAALTAVQSLNGSNGVYYFTGRSDGFGTGTSGNSADARLDAESVRVANDGNSIYISDEYGPYVYQIDRQTGVRLKSFTLPATFYVAAKSAMGATEISGNTSGRVANKGMEGLAITPDGTTLVGFVQSPLIQDGGDGGRCNRIITIDIATGATHQYVYDNMIGSKSYNSSEILAINSHEFLVDERDGKGLGDGSSAVIKRLYKIDIAGATDVSGLSGESTLLPYAVSKTLFLDIQAALVNSGTAATAIPSKIEGVAFGPDMTISGSAKHTLWIANDNDFVPDTSGTNRFYVFAFSDADLGGSTYVGQAVTPYAGATTAVTGVSLSTTTLSLNVGGASGSLTPVVLPALASNKAVTWTSSLPAVATVTGGRVTPLSVGSTTITATVSGGFTATCNVTVGAAVVAATGVTLSSTSLNFVQGDAAKTLTATVSPSNATNSAVTWATDNTAVATVANGTVTAVNVGTAHITATTVDGGFVASCAVSVTAASVSVTGVTLDHSSLTLSGAKTLKATVTPADATDASITWTTGNASIATVSGGVVTAVAVGSTTITATASDGTTQASCAVTVVPFYGFDNTGLLYSKVGLTGAWGPVDSSDTVTFSNNATALSMVITRDDATFYGIVNQSSTYNNGNIYQKTGINGTWSLADGAVAPGTMKAVAYDGTQFYGFTNTGKYNTEVIGGDAWGGSNSLVTGTTPALIAVVFDGTTFYGFNANGTLFTTSSYSTTTTAWASGSTNSLTGVSLVSVVSDGSTYYGITSDGLLYTKVGLAGSWSTADASNASATALISLTCQ